MKSLEKELNDINITNIAFDPNNPRGEKAHQIVSDKEFGKLVNSIYQHGILEPLIVKKNENKKDFYILIDGERRLRAAIKVAETEKNRDAVPALLAKNDMDGRILAYQVHMLRKNWNLAAETKAIKQIIKDIRELSPKINDSDLKKKLKEITAHKPHELTDILKMIKFDDDIINDVLSGQLDQSYLVQIESNFMNPLKKKYPLIIKKFDEDTIRQILAQKARSGLLGNTRFLMDKFKVLFNDTTQKDKINDLLVDFIENKNKNIKDTYKEYESLGGKTAKKVTKKKQSPKVYPKAKEPTSHYKELKITKKQQTSFNGIQKKIESIAKTFSVEEYEYISEGLYCLKSYCFKAAVLMLWATAISRMLFFIDKNLHDFNACSKTMKLTPKSVWNHLSKNFKINYTDIEEIRVQSNDLHLLCYLCLKKIIDVPQFKKLKGIYGMRNDCGHPTGIEISVNEVIAAFDNVYFLILNNKRLK